MSSDAAALRRLWWVPVLGLVAGDLALFVLLQGPLEALPARRTLLRYLPLALHLLPRVALFAWAWPRLGEGGAYQTLLAAQAALPLLHLALAWGVVPTLVARGLLAGPLLWTGLRLLPPLLELGALALAFRLRASHPEEAELAVPLSAAFAVLGGGWLALGLLPLLAAAFGDPLREELCQGSATRASLAGFLTLLALPLALLASLGPPWGRSLLGFPLGWLPLPALLLGAWNWTRLGARLGPAGRGWRILTRLGIALLGLLLLAALLILWALGARPWR